jgi:hypothetical protein
MSKADVTRSFDDHRMVFPSIRPIYMCIMTDLAKIVVDDLEENFHAVKIGMNLSL